VLCVSGPTLPRESAVDGETLWRLISHLSLNFHSVVGDGQDGGKVPLRELLQLYCHPSDRALLKQIGGVQSVASRPVVRRVDTPGLLTFVRGSELTVKLDEVAFTGSGIFVFGAVLERFLAKYASINSFTETVISSPQRGEVIRWPIQTGIRPLL
jgi:type VI secretion system protein ImpG